MDWLKIFRGEKKPDEKKPDEKKPGGRRPDGKKTGGKKKTAQVAKERLMIAVAHQRQGNGRAMSFLPQMREELLDVVRKYIQVPDDSLQFTVQREDGLEVLELNITLPEDIKG